MGCYTRPTHMECAVVIYRGDLLEEKPLIRGGLISVFTFFFADISVKELD
jgi:hypothetical protein